MKYFSRYVAVVIVRADKGTLHLTVSDKSEPLNFE